MEIFFSILLIIEPLENKTLANLALVTVILSEKLTYEVLPETVNLCPTLEEAIDLIEFEEIQRDLGL